MISLTHYRVLHRSIRYVAGKGAHVHRSRKTAASYMRRPAIFAAAAALLVLGSGIAAWAAASSSFGTTIFSDGFESGDLSAWNGNVGNGTVTVTAAAAHSGSYGARLTNTSGQADVLLKTLDTPQADTSTTFWVRISGGTGFQTVAQARNQASNAYMWQLGYDPAHQQFDFFPYTATGSTEIDLGTNTAPADTWIKVEIRYTATATGGAQILLNDQTQSAWGVSGDYSRTDNYARLQLWNDTTSTTDFDDVTIAVPDANVTVPDAPTGVTGVAGNASVALSWTAPASDGGSTITGYQVTPYVSGIPQTPIQTNSTATSYTVTGLTNGTSYTFTVAAINSVGASAESAQSGSVTPEPVVPTAPSNVGGTAGNASVALSWTAPASDGGSTITGYQVTPYISGAAQSSVATGSTATSFTVTGLTNGTAYTFTVVAVNAVGTGPASVASGVLTPTAPSNVVFADGFESGDLSAWNGNIGTGTAAVTTGAAHSGTYGVRLTNTSGQYDALLKRLDAPLVNSSTTFWMRVSNAAGNEAIVSARNDASNAATWQLLYDPVQQQLYFYPFQESTNTSTEIPTGANSVPLNTWVKVQVTYNASTTGGAQIYLNDQTQSAWGVSGDYSRTDNFQRLQLANDTTSTTDFDDVSISDASVTVPGAPTAVQGTAGNASVALSWTAPASDGGSAITGYRVTPYINEIAQTAVLTSSTATSYTVTGLTNGTAYTFTVAAINAVGASAESAASAAVTPAAPTSNLVNPMPVISRNVPAYGTNEIYPASYGNDSTYGSGSGMYLCGPPCSLILDLSGVPVAQRQQAVVAWYNDATNFYAAAISNNYYNEPKDYTIDVSSDPGGSTLPTNWTNLVSVTGNFNNGREHVVNLNGANWIRMNVTAVNGSAGNEDAAFNLDVHDASQGTKDTWLILGDSITQDDMGHYEPSNFMQQINAAHPSYFPSQINGGIGGWTTGSVLATDPLTGQAYIDEFLADFPGHFVSLDYGTNDANLGSQTAGAYLSNMETLVNKVLAAGKVPVLRKTIPWGCTTNIQTYGPQINSDLATLLQEYPQAVSGPDEWAYFEAHQSQIGSDCIHPTFGDGNVAYRQVYIDAIQASVYQGL